MKQKVKKLSIISKIEAQTLLSGEHSSIFKFDGYDFDKLREYQSGDDTRKIDWIVSAKTQKPYIKIYNEERELNIVIALMLNGSTYFGTKKLKIDIIAQIYAILGYSAILQKDNLSTFIFADKLYKTNLPSKNIYNIEKNLEYIFEFNPINKKANYPNMINTLFKNIKDKSLIFIVGDFFDSSFNPILLSKKHQVCAIVTRDKIEESPKDLGFVSLIDLENSSNFKGIFTKNIRNKYKNHISNIDKDLKVVFNKSRVKFTKVYTEDNIFVRLKEFLKK